MRIERFAVPIRAGSEAAQARSKLALAVRNHAPESTIVEARRDLAAAKLEQYIVDTVAAAPPLNEAQRDRLAALLRGAK